MTRREIAKALRDARADHLCDDGAVGCEVCDGVTQAIEELETAQALIGSLKRGACWCDTVGHTPACIEAQRFMENAQ